MPKWWDLGVLRGLKLNSTCLNVIVSFPKPYDQIQPNLVCEFPRGQKKFFIECGHVAYQIDRDYE